MNRSDSEAPPTGERGGITQTQILVRPDLGAFDNARKERWEKFENQQIAIQTWTNEEAPEISEADVRRLLADEDTLKIVIGCGLASDPAQLDNSVSLVRTVFSQIEASDTLRGRKVVIIGASLNGFPGSLFREGFEPSAEDVTPDEYAGTIDDALAHLGCTPESTVVSGHSAAGEMALRLADKYAVVALHPAIGANTSQDIFSILESLEGISDRFGFIADKAEKLPGVGRFVKSFIHARREDLTNAILRWLVSDTTTALSDDIAYQVAMHVRCKVSAGHAYAAKLSELAAVDVNPFDRLAKAKFKPMILRSHGGDRLTKHEATQYYVDELGKHGLNVEVSAGKATEQKGIIEFDEAYSYGHDAPFLIQDACDKAAAAMVMQLENVVRAQPVKEGVPGGELVSEPTELAEVRDEAVQVAEIDPRLMAQRREFAMKQFTDLVVSIKQLLQDTNTKLDLKFALVDEFKKAGLDTYLSNITQLKEADILRYIDSDSNYDPLFRRLAQIELTLAWKKALIVGRSGASNSEVAKIAFDTVGFRQTWMRLHTQDRVADGTNLLEVPNTFEGVDSGFVYEKIVFNGQRTYGAHISTEHLASNDSRYNHLFHVKQLMGFSVMTYRDATGKHVNILEMSDENFNETLSALEGELQDRLKIPIEMHEQDFALMAGIMAGDDLAS